MLDFDVSVKLNIYDTIAEFATVRLLLATLLRVWRARLKRS